MGVKQKRETLNHLSVECSKPFADMSILQYLIDTNPTTNIDATNPLARELMKYHAQIRIVNIDDQAAEGKRKKKQLWPVSMDLSAGMCLDRY